MMSEQWMSIVEYARKYNVSDMTVRRRIRTGKLPAQLKEGKYYIPISEIANKAIEFSDIETRRHQPQLSESLPTVKVDSTAPAMDGARVLRYFEESLEQLKASELAVKSSYESKVLLLQEQLRRKDLEIRELKQEIEDMQILLSLVDQKLQPK